MKSRTSAVSKALIQDDWRRNFPLVTVYAVFLLVAVILPLRKSFINAIGLFPSEVAGDYFASVALVIPIYALFLGIALACALFFYITKSQSVNVMHAFPMKRCCHFLSHFITGIEMLTAGNLMVFVFSLIVEALHGGLDLESTIQYFLLAELTCIFYFSLGILSVMMTGWILAAPVFYIGMNVVAIAINGLLMLVEEILLYGYDGNTIRNFVAWLTPMYQMIVNYQNTEYTDAGRAFNPAAMPTALWYMAAAVILLAVSFLLYQKRKSESAGSVIAFSFLKPVIKQVIAFTGGLGLGLILLEVLSPDNISIWQIYLYSVLGGNLFILGCNMLIQKSVRVWNRDAVKDILVLAVIFVLTIIAVNADILNYQKKIPEAGDVESVMVTCSHSDTYVYVENAEYIEKVLAMHQKFIDRGQTEETCYGLTVNYTLNDSVTPLSRTYYYGNTDDEVLLQAIETVINDPSAKEAERKDILTDTANIIGGYFNLYEDEDKSVMLTKEEVEELVEQLKIDTRTKGNTDVHDRPVYAQCNIELHYAEKYVYISLYADDVNTISWLTEKGYIQDKTDIFLEAGWYYDE